MIYGSTINDTKYQVTSSPYLDFHGQVAFDPSFKVSYPVLDEGLLKYQGSLDNHNALLKHYKAKCSIKTVNKGLTK